MLNSSIKLGSHLCRPYLLENSTDAVRGFLLLSAAGMCSFHLCEPIRYTAFKVPSEPFLPSVKVIGIGRMNAQGAERRRRQALRSQGATGRKADCEFSFLFPFGRLCSNGSFKVDSTLPTPTGS